MHVSGRPALYDSHLPCALSGQVESSTEAPRIVRRSRRTRKTCVRETVDASPVSQGSSGAPLLLLPSSIQQVTTANLWGSLVYSLIVIV